MFVYYVVCEFVEQKATGFTKVVISCEISTHRKITNISHIKNLARTIMKIKNRSTPPVITFYKLLRKE
jgi:hypothetical protein